MKLENKAKDSEVPLPRVPKRLVGALFYPSAQISSAILFIVVILCSLGMSPTIVSTVPKVPRTTSDEWQGKYSTISNSQPATLWRGVLARDLLVQGLSHRFFHSLSTKRYLAALVTPKIPIIEQRVAVAVVGVEYGQEVHMLASTGYIVYAFEPIRFFFDKLQNAMRQNRQYFESCQTYGNVKSGYAKERHCPEKKWNIIAHQVAIGSDNNGNISLSYKEQNAWVPRARLDHYITEELTVLSIDIQGNELDVLKGSAELLKKKKIRSLWIEIGACNPKVLEILKLLDDEYVIFDFVPWGLSKGKDDLETMQPQSLAEHSPLMWEEALIRPETYDDYYKWMCRLKEFSFKWLQNDIIAIRRDLVTNEMRANLGSIGNDILIQAKTTI